MILSLDVEPLKRIALRLFTFPENVGDTRGGKEYELHFTKVAGFRFTSFHLPAKVQAHSVISDSALINDSLAHLTHRTVKINPAGLHHHQLLTETGQLDVVSELAVCVPMWDVSGG